MKRAQTVRQPSSQRELSDSDLKSKSSVDVLKELGDVERKLADLEITRTQLLHQLQEKGQPSKLSAERIAVVYDWEATDSNQLSILTGEEVILLQNPPSSEWVAVCKIGWIPKVCVPTSALSSRDVPPVARDLPPPVARDVPPPVARDVPPPVARDVPPPVVRDVPSPVARDVPPPVARDLPPPVARDAPPPSTREPSQTVVSRPIPSPGREVPPRKPAATVRAPSSGSITTAETPEPLPPGSEISYQDLVEKNVPAGTDLTRLEAYLSDAEFMNVFKMDKAAFYKQPAWKIATAKKRANLF